MTDELVPLEEPSELAPADDDRTRTCEWCGKTYRARKGYDKRTAAFCSIGCRGRASRFYLAAHELRSLERMAGNGVPLDLIAHELGMTAPTLRAILNRQGAARHAYRRGLAKEEQELVGALHRRAMDPEDRTGARAAEFLLRARHRYVDRPPEAPAVNSVSFVLPLPSALTPDEYRASLFGQTEAKALPAGDAVEAEIVDDGEES